MPDLRYSATLGDAGAWKAIVLDGAMVKNGMVTFEKYLKPDDVETRSAPTSSSAPTTRRSAAPPAAEP